MATKVIAFPGVILTAHEIGSEPPPRPPVTFTPCPVCAAPVSSEDPDSLTCDRCRVRSHAPCWWRALPISEWVKFRTWIDDDTREELGPHDFSCAACRQLEGPRKE
jgi:hypothetical protein